jgi:hypothetical protein
MSIVLNSYKPQNYEGAKGKDEWKRATKAEYEALIKNNTWVLTEMSPGTTPICFKWVYKRKYKADSSLDKHKVRLVVKGIVQ